MGIGYIGLGLMGGALARRLQITHPLKVYDLYAPSVQALVDLGANACASPAELAAECDVVLLCLPTSKEVRAALFGASGVAESARPGTLVIDQTSGDPVETRAMAGELAARGITLVDAPVSGGAKGAEAGTIAIMVGADDAHYARVHDILSAISPNIFRAGGVGAGQVMKLVNNVMSGAQRLLTLESVALAAKNGIDPVRACEILLAGGAKNSFLETFMIPKILKGDVSPGFTLALMHKDVRLACQLGSDTGVPMFFGNLAREFYQMCIAERGAQAQVHTAAQVIDRMSGTHFVPAAGPET